MKALLPLSLLLMLAACQNRTGWDSLDPFLVKDFEARIELSKALDGAKYYCNFGCADICSMVPEPTPRMAIWSDVENLSSKYDGLEKRATGNDLILDFARSKAVPALLPPRDLLEEQIAGAVESCLNKQATALEKIEKILARLDA